MTTPPSELQSLWNQISFQDGLGTHLPLNLQPHASKRYTFNERNIYIRSVLDPDPNNYNNTENENIEYLAVYGGGKGRQHSPACFFLRVNRKTHNAILQGTERRSDCFLDDKGEDSKLVVKAAYKWALQHKIKQIIFTDNSHIDCPESVELANLSFLTTGRTWYEAAVPGCKPLNPAIITRWLHDRERVIHNTWNDVAGKSPTLWTAFDSTGIDTSKPGSAMMVLTRAKSSRTACSAFSYHMEELLERSGIMSYYGKDWIWTLPIPLRRTRTTQRRRHRSTRRHSRHINIL